MDKSKIVGIRDVIKSTPVIGNFLLYFYRLYKKSFLKKYLLSLKDEKMARLILMKIFPNYKNVNKLISELKRNKLFNKDFSYGHAGNFDVFILYGCAFLLRPEIIIETGVASGRSSTFQLLALEKNKHGILHSIDLPQYFEDKPKIYNVEGNFELDGFVPKGNLPGWLIPDELRDRWRLYLGKSSELLPKILIENSSVDMFYHDSDHSYENMHFEYETIWPYLRSGGLLISDDIKWNRAFDDFVKEKNIKKYYKYRSFGIILKD